jgi:Xaa-Pro aminopeptidase
MYILYSGNKGVDKNFVYLTEIDKLDYITAFGDNKCYDITKINIDKIEKVYTLSNYAESDLLKKLLKNKKIKIIDHAVEKARIIKNKYEINNIKFVTERLSSVINSVINDISKYKYEYQVVDAIQNKLKKYDICKEAFPSICVNGRNNIELHYSRNDNKLLDGNLMILDIGFYYNNYCCDVARTIPIGGKFTEKQKLMYDMIRRISDYAIKKVKIGIKFKEWENMVFMKYMKYLYKLKFIKEQDITLVKLFMPHRLGHSIGLEVHDIDFKRFKNGVVFTIEPGIYFMDKLYENDKINKDIIADYYYMGGIRIEDTIGIINNKVINFSKNLNLL